MLLVCFALLNTNVIFAQMNATSVDSFNNTPDSSYGNYGDEPISHPENTTSLTGDACPTGKAESDSGGNVVDDYLESEVQYAAYGNQKNESQQYAAYGEAAGAGNYTPVDLVPYQNSTGALWVRYWSMDAVNLEELKAAGITDIFLDSEALTNSKYQNSSARFLQNAQESGIRVSVWVNCFKPNSTWIDPANESSATYITDLLSRIGILTGRAGINGVHLDYIRYPGNAYQQVNGTTSINSFVSRVRDVVKAIKPDALLSAALMPEGAVNAYYYGQNYTELANYLDVLVPMIYKGNYNKNTSWIGSVTNYIVSQSAGTPVWTGILTYQSDNNLTTIGADELFGDVVSALKNGADGYVLFRYGLLDEGFFEYSSAMHNPTAGENSNNPISFSPGSIKDAASRVKEYIESNQRLPNFVTINNRQLNMSEYLYLLAKVLELNSGSNTPVAYKKIIEPLAPMGDPVNGTLNKSEYLDIASRLVKFMDTNLIAPNFASSSLGKIRFENLVYSMSRAVDFVNKNNQLPNFVTVLNIDLSTPGQGTAPVSPPPTSGFSLSSIQDAASRVNEFIASNQKLPNFVTINQKQLNMSEYLYLLLKATTQTNTNNNNPINHQNITEPTNSTGNMETGTLNKAQYLDLAQRILQFMETNKQAPNFATHNQARIKYENLIYAYTRIMDFTKNNNQLPHTVNIINIQGGTAPANPPTNNNPNAFTLASIQDAANRVKTFIETNQKLPNFVTINQKQLNMSEYLYLLLKATTQTNTNNNNPINHQNITEPTNSTGNMETGTLNKAQYLDLAQRILQFMETNKQAPNFATHNQARIKYENLIYAYTRIMDFTKNNNQLPNTVNIINIQGGTAPVNPPTNNNPNAFTLASIQDAATRVKTFIETNQKLPNFVTINQKQLNMSEYLYLLLKATTQTNTNNNNPINHQNITEPTNSTGNMETGTLNKAQYLDLAQRILQFMETNKQAPNFATHNQARIKYENLIYAYTRIMDFTKNNNQLPNTVAIIGGISSSGSSLTTPYQGEGLNQYLVATQNCQVNNAQIQSLSASLTSGLNNNWDKAEAIFNWVRNNLRYEFYYNTKYGAVNTLVNRSGNCVDHTHLVVALSRAAGIPARYAHGDCTFNSGSTYGHVWAEILIGNQWYAADATSYSNSLGIINSWNTATVVMKGRHSNLPW
ncbi:pseudomurein-binding repeat-containing protein [Methanobacterium movens]